MRCTIVKSANILNGGFYHFHLQGRHIDNVSDKRRPVTPLSKWFYWFVNVMSYYFRTPYDYPAWFLYRINSHTLMTESKPHTNLALHPSPHSSHGGLDTACELKPRMNYLASDCHWQGLPICWFTQFLEKKINYVRSSCRMMGSTVGTSQFDVIQCFVFDTARHWSKFYSPAP